MQIPSPCPPAAVSAGSAKINFEVRWGKLQLPLPELLRSPEGSLQSQDGPGNSRSIEFLTLLCTV